MMSAYLLVYMAACVLMYFGTCFVGHRLTRQAAPVGRR
jgi:hypothetical protein